jgi:hypothetical protein
MKFPYDRSSKWLITHHGDAMLRLAGLSGIVAWKAVQPEVVQPRQSPDGLLEVRFADRADPRFYLLEVATYPDTRIGPQLLDDLVHVYLDRRVLPESVVLVLHPKGNIRAEDHAAIQSPQGWSELRARWRIVELWKVPAAPLLAADDPGLVPWIPLTQFDGPPEPILRQCREIIDRKSPQQEQANLLAVTQVLAGLRYNNVDLLTLFGGKSIMIESPVLVELVNETTQSAILQFLTGRFGQVPPEIAARLRAVQDPDRLSALTALAGRCADLSSFAAAL